MASHRQGPTDSVSAPPAPGRSHLAPLSDAGDHDVGDHETGDLDTGDHDAVDIGEALFASGELDLHTFSPRDLRALVPDFLDGCHARGHRQVRIIHGKGTGALRRSVEALLRRHPLVASFGPGDERQGAWGATVVQLRQSDV